MIGKLKSLASKLQPQAPKPAVPPKPAAKISDSFGVTSRDAAVRASGPKMLMGMPSDDGGKRLEQAVVFSRLTPENQAAYQGVMQQLIGNPVAQDYVNTVVKDATVAQLMGEGSFLEIGEKSAEILAEAVAYAAMNEHDRKIYDDAMEAMEGDPEGQAALKKLLREGTLTAQENEGDPRLIDMMGTVTDAQSLQGEISAGEVLSAIVQGIAEPGSLGQAPGTFVCSTLAGFEGLAIKDPVTYARMLAELATEGKTTSPGGMEFPMREASGFGFMHDVALSHLDEITGDYLEVHPDGRVTFNAPPPGDAGLLEEIDAQGQHSMAATMTFNDLLPDAEYAVMKLDPRVGPDGPRVPEVDAAIQQSIENGGVVQMKVYMDGEAHVITVTAVDEDGNYIFTMPDGQKVMADGATLIGNSDAVYIDTTTTPGLDTASYQWPADYNEDEGGGSNQRGMSDSGFPVVPVPVG